MARWIRTVRLEELTDDRGTEVVAEGRMFAIFRAEGEPYVLDGLCCHQGGPLGKAPLCGFVATCPWHGWQYDVRTGENEFDRALALETFAVVVEDGEIKVAV